MSGFPSKLGIGFPKEAKKLFRALAFTNVLGVNVASFSCYSTRPLDFVDSLLFATLMPPFVVLCMLVLYLIELVSIYRANGLQWPAWVPVWARERLGGGLRPGPGVNTDAGSDAGAGDVELCNAAVDVHAAAPDGDRNRASAVPVLVLDILKYDGVLQDMLLMRSVEVERLLSAESVMLLREYVRALVVGSSNDVAAVQARCKETGQYVLLTVIASLPPLSEGEEWIGCPVDLITDSLATKADLLSERLLRMDLDTVRSPGSPKSAGSFFGAGRGGSGGGSPTSPSSAKKTRNPLKLRKWAESRADELLELLLSSFVGALLTPVCSVDGATLRAGKLEQVLALAQLNASVLQLPAQESVLVPVLLDILEELMLFFDSEPAPGSAGAAGAPPEEAPPPCGPCGCPSC